MKILIATEKAFAPIAVKGIREIVEKAGHELVLLENYKKPEELLEAIKEVEAVIIRSDKVTPAVVEAGKKLKIVVRAGAGYDNVDLPACTKAGIVVMNTPGQNSNAVAELAIGMMIYAFRNMFQPGTGIELRGKTLGLAACGNVGQCVKKISEGFGMQVAIYDPYLKMEGKVEKLEDLFAQNQIVSLHMPSTKETKGLIGYDLVMKMPKNGLLVNTARKEIINEEEVIKAMKERKDLKYVTDIAPASKEFEEFKGRYFTTPRKMGAETEEANVNSGLAAARQIVAFFATGDIKFKVN
ncbi:Erythronate-4-phosphate dehydrogenase, putative [Entamoeba invadens IP1]|uniref:Erythronate-4-phosphate dehydrogenase, putative n=1 Tax=Entamoeba invadens TaxID=33085 RepID=S0B7S5_ENTIV|nr:Erythronate-4-phosphate dehydrogenase, putative [Entamoeba invadens IP1]ELP93544.1 Erythronate-4-phosphate dehydrogenase, putative [Entamoeba invadens IP1]BAN41757.1 erythronate-4-phosphate dehydrogenase, putative [Entamoeba invadens]BAN42052.1 erythronate-4-phosphate dehydrogenase, putative [Entamoeba invadens]|eukprot:XP_004260315.1 Erythronate-4-phosphate dehydrogenase, putative [Entamoeba invadens IP1]